MEGTILGGRFCLEREIGRGGMGAVYRAVDERTGGVAAVKLLHAVGDQIVARFEREAELLASLAVEGVVAWLDHGRTASGELYLAMEWLDGEDLTARLGRGPMSLARTVALGACLAETLARVHAAGVVHRDIKPPNIFLPKGGEGRPKILDFGIAHLGALSADATALTARGMMLGTPGYLAPEQVRGEVVVDARADIFALGIVLHECLTAQALFAGGEMMAVLGRVLFDPAPFLVEICPGTPVALAELVAWMLQKDPSDRPASMSVVATALAELGELGGDAPTAERFSVLGDLEQRVVGVVAAAPPGGLAEDATWLPTQDDALRAAIAPLGPTHGARVEVLADGSIVGVVTIPADASEQALRTGRLALALRGLVGAVPIAVVTGRTVVGAGIPVGATLDRAIALLRRAAPGEIVADGETARWLSARFLLDDSGADTKLEGERIVEAPAERRLAFSGRHEELDHLASLTRRAMVERRAAGVRVEGEVGIGKTRLAEELVRATLRGDLPARVLWLAGDPMRAKRPLSTLTDGLRVHWALPPLDETSRRHRIGSELGSAVDAVAHPRVLAFLCELLDVGSPHDTMLEAARRDAALMADQRRRALSDWLRGAAAARPLLVIVDDLQWVDPVTASLLEDLALERANVPLFIAVFGRPGGESPAAPLRLGPLPERAARELARAALDETQLPRLDAIVDRAAGNPLFLTELVRSSGTDQLPPTIAATLQIHLSELSANQRRVLRAAAILGHRFWGGAVATLAGDEAAASTTLGELVALGYLARAPLSRIDHELEYRFVAHLLRDTCYATLTPEDRRRGHRMAAQWLTDHGEDDAEALAHHHEAAGRPEQAARSLARAVRQALAGNELEHALELSERAFSLGLPEPLHADIRVLTGEAKLWLGDSSGARLDAQRAFLDAETGGAVFFQAAGVLGDACLLMGDATPLAPVVAALLGAEPTHGHDESVEEAALDASARVAAALASLARFTAADALLARAEASVARRPARSPMTEGRLAHARAVHGSCCGDLGAAIRFFEMSGDAFARAGSLRFASAARTNLATKLLEVGCPDEARPLVDGALTMAGIVAVPYCVTFASFTRGLVLLAQGEAACAAQVLRATLPRLEELGDPRLLSSAHGALAEALVLLDDAVGAQSQASLALARVEATELAPQRAAAFGVLARIHHSCGRPELALAAARDGMSMRVTTRMEEREADLRLVYAEALAAMGEDDAARDVLLEARERLIERAARIEAGARRGGFLTAVPVNARTFALARAWNLPPPP